MGTSVDSYASPGCAPSHSGFIVHHRFATIRYFHSESQDRIWLSRSPTEVDAARQLFAPTDPRYALQSILHRTMFLNHLLWRSDPEPPVPEISTDVAVKHLYRMRVYSTFTSKEESHLFATSKQAAINALAFGQLHELLSTPIGSTATKRCNKTFVRQVRESLRSKEAHHTFRWCGPNGWIWIERINPTRSAAHSIQTCRPPPWVAARTKHDYRSRSCPRDATDLVLQTLKSVCTLRQLWMESDGDNEIEGDLRLSDAPAYS